MQQPWQACCMSWNPSYFTVYLQIKCVVNPPCQSCWISCACTVQPPSAWVVCLRFLVRRWTYHQAKQQACRHRLRNSDPWFYRTWTNQIWSCVLSKPTSMIFFSHDRQHTQILVWECCIIIGQPLSSIFNRNINTASTAYLTAIHLFGAKNCLLLL